MSVRRCPVQDTTDFPPVGVRLGESLLGKSDLHKGLVGSVEKTRRIGHYRNSGTNNLSSITCNALYPFWAVLL